MAYEDLLKDSSESFEDGNYFVVTIEELSPGTVYPLQFRWKYKDGSYGKDWSAAYNLILNSESVPGAPGVTANGDTPGMITISWNGKNVQNTDIQNTIKQVDIYISGSPFDGTKPALNFDKAGTKTIPAPSGLYTIVAYGLTARGTVSTQTTISNIQVTDIATPVEDPTLPSGLSVASAPFAVSVNWGGSYTSSDFDGFKSVDIHVRGSDVGSTATSGFSTTTQVATLTVTGTTNRQNIGLDNLRQALSLANNQAAYTSPMFFYYIARNVNDSLYSVGGTPTYTRINSTSVNPTQANFIDLASGVISIENLVAGNGQFSSWLRTGSAGGTRIELSAVNDFTNNGYTVQKGLVAYSSGSTEIFNLDIDAGTLTINGSGTFTGDLSAGSGSSIFKSDSDGIYLGATTFAGAANKFRVSRSGVMNAASGTIGGLTLATDSLSNSANTFKIGSTGQLLLGSESAGQSNFILTPTQIVHRIGSTPTGNFTLDISTGTLTLSGYASSSALNNKSKTYYQNDQPSSGMIQGDIWIDANDSYKVYTYTGSTWQLAQDAASAQTTANTAANRAQKFDLVGNVNLGISLNTSGSIYSNKTTYGSGTTGWFLGYRDLGGGTLTPALDIGGTSSYLRWTGTGIEVKGDITGSNGTFSGTVSIASGTKSAVLDSTLATLTLTDTSTGFLSGGAVLIQSGSEYSSYSARGISVGGSIFIGNDGSNNIYIQGGATTGIRLSPAAGLGSTTYTVQIEGHLNNAAYSNTTGTYSSSSTEQSTGTYLSATGAIIARRDNQIPIFAHRYNTTGTSEMIRLVYNGSDAGGIQTTSAGNPSFKTASDYRLKNNIQDYMGSKEIIKGLRVRSYEMNNNPGKTEIGFIAHEYAEVVPEMVNGTKDAVDENGSPEYQSISTTNLIPYLVGALKESILKIEYLEQRLDALEG